MNAVVPIHPRRAKRLGAVLGLALCCAASVAVAEPDYVNVPAGTFDSVLSAGSGVNAPVSVAAFQMRASPVTSAEYLAFTQRSPEWQRGRVPAVFADGNYLRQLGDASAPDATQSLQPVTNVSWFAAEAYCESEGARLPTWYEWEYVAAADAQHADARRDPQWLAKILGWYARPSNQSLPAVGGTPNYYGVRDVHGLVWEWVDDFNALLVSADSRNQGDPDQLQYCGAGAISLQDRDNFAVLMRVALLSSLSGSDSTSSLGFRCARSPAKE